MVYSLSVPPFCTVFDAYLQGWCRACHGVGLPVRMYCFLAVQIVPSRCVFISFRIGTIFSNRQQVWQLADGNFRSGAVQTARWHQSGVSSLAISTSGSRLASCSSEGTIIWGVQANRITLLCSCYIPTFPAAPLCLDSNDDIILQVRCIPLHSFAA